MWWWVRRNLYPSRMWGDSPRLVDFGLKRETNMGRKGMGGHHSAKAGTTCWVSPRFVTDALGVFDLDPCSFEGHPWPVAADNWCLPQRDGMSEPWHGRVWLNPPYGQECADWLRKLGDHGNGIALVFARTETAMFQKWVFPRASGILFLSGRLYFHFPDGTRAKANAGAPSCLIAYGAANAEILRTCGLAGAYYGLASM